MIRYVVSRLIVSAAMVLLATLVIFLIANTVPGDPVLTALGDMAASDPVQVADFRARWGLDLPLWQQYWLFLERLVHGDLGVSISSRRPVLQDIIDYAPASSTTPRRPSSSRRSPSFCPCWLACRSACWRQCGGTP
jgi:peptide/nickel transport system permease protein